MPKLSVIIPCYFNEPNIPVTAAELLAIEDQLGPDVEVEYVAVDDGSKDRTFDELLNFQRLAPDRITVVKLSRNFGANNASYAGMHHATGDCCVFVAADLQDPPELIAKMFDYWRKGIKLVIANRASRDDPWYQTLVSNLFHYVMRNFALPSAPSGGFDLILFDRQLGDDILRIDDRNLNLPYLFVWLGYDYVSVPYVRRKRLLGQSRWTLAKKIKALVDAVVAFSYLPIRLISISGIGLGLLAAIYGVVIVSTRLIGNVPVEGWSSLMVALLVVSAFQMTALGILGEYLWRTLDASRTRPNFIIDRVIPRGRPVASTSHLDSPSQAGTLVGQEPGRPSDESRTE